jgi:molybdate transport system substrate-binding protein
LRRFWASAAVAAVLPVAGCGGPAGGNASKAPLTVSAASSLQRALTAYGRRLSPSPRFSFAGSGELAAQIRQGAKPDVFVAADEKLPAALSTAHLVEKPVVVAANRLVLATPARGARVHSLADLERAGVKLAIGSPSVPVGSYTRTVLERLGAAESRRILRNVRSQEPDVKGVVGKLVLGAVDAGFVYATDVNAAGGKLVAIRLPDALRPQAAYAAAVVTGTSRRTEAARFVAALREGGGQSELRRAGFAPPPAK